jgi:hypothetical protein
LAIPAPPGGAGRQLAGRADPVQTHFGFHRKIWHDYWKGKFQKTYYPGNGLGKFKNFPVGC